MSEYGGNVRMRVNIKILSVQSGACMYFSCRYDDMFSYQCACECVHGLLLYNSALGG